MLFFSLQLIWNRCLMGYKVNIFSLFQYLMREKKIGEVVSNFDQIVPACRRMLEAGTLARYKANAAAVHNRAIFDIPEILEKMLGCAT